MGAELDVTILDRQRGRRTASRGLRAFVQRVAGEVSMGGPAAVTVCLVSDRRMRELNRRYRGKDRTTDVLSFPGETAPGPDGIRELGDVVISVPTAERQAREQGHGTGRELKLLALHGYLHLLGYDHETDDGRMMRLQRRLERRLLPRGRERR